MIDTPEYGILENLDEFAEAIDIGMDIEFFLYGVHYNISSEDKPFICVCLDGDAVYFDDADSLLKGYKVNGKPLGELWRDFKIKAM